MHSIILVDCLLCKLTCLLISGWDADFATEAYRQQVEALAQHQVGQFYCMVQIFLQMCPTAG